MSLIFTRFEIYLIQDKSKDTVNIKTRMTTFIKTKFKRSDDQTSIEKSRITANITE